MTFPTTQVKTAARLIKKYGQAVVWRQVLDGPLPDATKPWKSGAATTTDFPTFAVFLTSKRVSYAFQQYIASGQVPAGKITCLVSGNLGCVPTLKDLLIRAGRTYSPEYIEPLSPNGVPILYTVWFAKA